MTKARMPSGAIDDPTMNAHSWTLAAPGGQSSRAVLRAAASGVGYPDTPEVSRGTHAAATVAPDARGTLARTRRPAPAAADRRARRRGAARGGGRLGRRGAREAPARPHRGRPLPARPPRAARQRAPAPAGAGPRPPRASHRGG